MEHSAYLGQDMDNQRAALKMGRASSHCLIALARFPAPISLPISVNAI